MIYPLKPEITAILNLDSRRWCSTAKLWVINMQRNQVCLLMGLHEKRAKSTETCKVRMTIQLLLSRNKDENQERMEVKEKHICQHLLEKSKRINNALDTHRPQQRLQQSFRVTPLWTAEVLQGEINDHVTPDSCYKYLCVHLTQMWRRWMILERKMESFMIPTKWYQKNV